MKIIAAVVCVMIANDESFTSSPFSTNINLSIPPNIQDLLEILNDVLIINDNNTDNYSVMSSPKYHMIKSTIRDQTHTSTINLSSPIGKVDIISLELQLTDVLMRTSLAVKHNDVVLGVEFNNALNYKLL